MQAMKEPSPEAPVCGTQASNKNDLYPDAKFGILRAAEDTGQSPVR